ncbi:phage tail assembly chaperone [Zavarzinia sp.]|uniref:phage tail assembly chaperone n=1 Tax=Zavarzinia sp. TaxID=2027920 RepID=UPI003BB722C6
MTDRGAETIAWRDYLGVATGLLRWSPAAFWAATPHEFWAAIEARRRAYGKATAPPPSDDEIQAIRRRHAGG